MMCCNCQNPFENTLRYSSPAHGGWGVVRMGHLLPESYQLFVSPAACGRHGAVGACMQGRKSRVSYLYLREEEIVSGGYEDQLLEAVDELLEYLASHNKTPKVLMIFVSCIDDLLGTDHDALLMQIRERHSDVRCIFCHMNPTSIDTSVPPPVNIQNKIYSLLDPVSSHDDGVNMVGNLAPLLPNCEAYRLLPQMSASPVRHLTDYRTFADWQEMSRSRLNLVIAPPGEYSAMQMQKKHGTPYEMALTSYDPLQVSQTYRGIAAALGADCPDVSDYETRCAEEMEKTAKALGGIPVVIDEDSVARPFDLAKALLEHGFALKRIIAQNVVPTDQQAYEWIRRHAPQIEIVQPQHHRTLLFHDSMPDCLALGYNSGYLTGSSHVIPADAQQGHWGYAGILDMMRLFREGAAHSTDLKALIDAAGLVV